MDDKKKNERLEQMFAFRTKHHKKIKEEYIASYKKTYFKLKSMQESKKLPVDQDYLNGNELASDIFKRKYFLKDLSGDLIESRPEDVFLRLSSFMASVEKDNNQESSATTCSITATSCREEGYQLEQATFSG
jgi:ribonucleoside-diphosphate reductase alpha chain